MYRLKKFYISTKDKISKYREHHTKNIENETDKKGRKITLAVITGEDNNEFSVLTDTLRLLDDPKITPRQERRRLF